MFWRGQGASPGGAFSLERLQSRLVAFFFRADTACPVPGRFAGVGLRACFRECWVRVAPFLVPGAIAIATPVAAAPALRSGIIFFLVALSPRLFLDQGLTVGNRNLIIIRVDFRESKKPMPVAAVVDEGGLKRRLDPHDLGEINIAAKLFLAGGFEIELLDPVTAKDDHSGFFGVRRIDKHFVGHVKLVQARRAKGQCRQPRSANRTSALGVAGARPHHAMDGRESEKKEARGGKMRRRSVFRLGTNWDAARGYG